MKLCVVSDVHGNRGAHEFVKTLVPDANLYVDCGDSEYDESEIRTLKKDGWICVRGNMDYNYELEDKEYFEFAGYKFLVMHGDRMTYRTFDEDIDIILRGHSHVFLFDDTSYEKIVINPGSFSKPRDNDMRWGLGEFCTIHIDENKKLTVERIIIDPYKKELYVPNSATKDYVGSIVIHPTRGKGKVFKQDGDRLFISFKDRKSILTIDWVLEYCEIKEKKGWLDFF